MKEHEGWACEARRYYFNICGKYGRQVQTLLNKIKDLPMEYICPLHGPVIQENLQAFVRLYHIWSSYQPENEGVLIAYASIHGHTQRAVEILKQQLKELGVPKVVVTDLAREDMAEAVENAFRYDRMILAASSYDGRVVPCMESFLRYLKVKNYQKRKVGIVQNGSWAPSAARVMRELLAEMQEIEVLEPVVTINAKVKDADVLELSHLAKVMTRCEK